MNEREVIKKSLSVLHASEHTIEEVLNMAENKKYTNRNGQKTGKTLLIAAAMVMALAATAFAADYVINHRNIFFFDTVEALAAAQRTDDAQVGSYEVPASAEENADMETVAEYVARTLEFGRYGDETLLSDETDDTPETLWERRRATECLHDDYGRITNTYFAGEAYAEKLVVEGLLDWDLSAVAGSMTPDEQGQIVLISRDAKDQTLVMANALLGYTTDEGKRFQIEYKYDAEARYMKDAEYILSSEYDGCYVYSTSDQVEVLIEAYDGQIWASAVNTEAGNAVYFYTTGCTTGEMEVLLDALNLAVVMNAGT